MLYGAEKPRRPLIARATVAILGSSVAVAMPVFTKLSVVDPAVPFLTGAQAIVTGTLVAFFLIWCLSVVLATAAADDNLWKCALDSFGIPGLFISLLVGFQGIQ